MTNIIKNKTILLAAIKNKFAVCNLQFTICISLLTANCLLPTFSSAQPVWSQTSNPTASIDYAYAITDDATSIYVAGFAGSPAQWRIEKRNKSDGALDGTFGGGTGYVQVGSSIVAYAITIDATSIYTAGSYFITGPSDYGWRIEKRDKGTGVLDGTFGTGGVITNNPSTNTASDEYARAITIDATGIYVAGHYWVAAGNYGWRVEKRDLSTGALITTFGSPNGYVNRNQNSWDDRATAITIDATGIYVVGYCRFSSSTDLRWEINKRDLSTGLGIAAFDGDGFLQCATVTEIPSAITLNASGIYVAGYDAAASSRQWRIEKRDLTSGAYDGAFGGGFGYIQSNPSGDLDEPKAIALDANGLYIAGYDEQQGSGNEQWRIEQRDLTTGALICSIVNNISASEDAIYAITSDGAGVYVAGIAQPSDYEWRIEKYASCLVINVISQNLLCNGQCTGTATVTPTGGTSPYTYNWSNGQTTQTATGLCAQTYTIIVTDAVGSTNVNTVVITEPAVLTASVSATTILCNGGTADATATANGGTFPYTYSWTTLPVQTTQTATGLTAGNYTVTITDNNSCTTTQTVAITEPAVLTASVSATTILCNGGTADATVTANGGTSPYTYSWTTLPVQTTQTATGLTAGNYTATVTDNNGCTATQTVSITQPTAISLTISATQTSCSVNTGTATVNASGGTGGYTYWWNPTSQTTSTATGLGVGNYTVIVTDANGCTQTTSVTVINPNAPTVSLFSQSNVSCNGGNDGSAAVTVSGGTPAYSYSWSPSGGSSSAATGLTAGNYTVTITDANGCTITQTVSITQPTSITASTNVTPATCGNNNGSATVIASGGTGSFTYLWDPSGQTASAATGLSSGTYTVTVTDSLNCTATTTIQVTASSVPTVTVTSTSTGCSTNNGMATANVSGGTLPYTYFWNNGQTTSTATGLGAGTYTITVTDNAGCTAIFIATVTISSGPTAAAGTTVTILQGSSTTLIAGGGITYSWVPSTGLSCDTCANPTASPSQTTEYCVYVFDTAGCWDSACVWVFVEIPCGEFYIPNSFSPNGDGKNDVFRIRIENIACITDLKLMIYNRWGEKVIEIIDPATGWDGTYKGKTENTSVFVYYLEATFIGEKINMKGTISLIR